MIGKKLFDEITNKLGDTIDNSPVKDVEKNVKSLLGSAFTRMDLITREEFDIQQQVLLKTREKLAELEARVTALEAHAVEADAVALDAKTSAEPTA